MRPANRNVMVLLLIAFGFPLFGQEEIPVNMYLGKPSITIPLGTVSSGDISQDVYLSYDANNARVSSPCGSGWDLAGPGSIVREVRSFPDDAGYGLDVKGWMYINASGYTSASNIGNFTPAADTLATWDAGEATDHAKLTGFNYRVDSQPDIFSYNLGDGSSGGFVIDNGLVIRTMPYDDIDIQMSYASASDKRITGFTIKTNTGYVYTFDHKVSVTKSTTASIYSHADAYVTTEYELYRQPVTYTREWKLTRIDSPNGTSYITFGYFNDGTNHDRPVDIALYQYPDPIFANPSDVLFRTVYHIKEQVGHARLSSITSSSGPEMAFQYNGTLQTITLSDTRRGATPAEQLVKNFAFSYMPVMVVNDRVNYDVEKTEPFLVSVVEYSGCERMPPVKFVYNDIRQGTYYHPGNHLSSGTTSLFPALYIYPDEPAAERYRAVRIPNYSGQEIAITAAGSRSTGGGLSGTLRSITNQSGGVTTFFFEENQYLDLRTNTNRSADGLRIRAIEYFDGFNPVPIRKTFQYTDPVTGLSSGRLIRKPVYAMPAFKWKSSSGSAYDKTWETAGMTTTEKWQYLTIRSTDDLSAGERTYGSTVGYTAVTVKRPGAGSVRHEYEVPAVDGEYVKGAWKATTNRFARSSSSLSMGGVTKGGPWMFPYTENPDFDYERGRNVKKSEFDESGKLVRETVTTYQYLYKSGTAPFKVWGLRYDKYPGTDNTNKIFFYGKYFLLTEANKVPKKEIVRTFDVSDPSGTKFLAESTEYFYESTSHKLVTRIARTASDATVYGTRIKYPADYTTQPTGAPEVLMIAALKDQKRNGIPIEQLSTVKKGTGPERVVAGSVLRLDPMEQNRPLVRSRWELALDKSVRLDSFQHSTVVNVNGYKFRMDPRYQKVDSISAYTADGKVQSRFDPLSRQWSATAYGYNSTVPVLKIANTTAAYVAFSDFETTTGAEFSSATAYYGQGRSGAKAFHPSVMLYKTVVKAPVRHYVLSFWVKSNAALNLTVSLKDNLATTTYHTQSIVVPSTSSQYQYVQKLIPLAAVPVPYFRIEIQASGLAVPPSGSPSPGGTLPSLLPVLDDIFFYPENAVVEASTYKFPFGVASVTTGTGDGTFRDYDLLGREKFVYDKHHDIVKRNVYFLGEESPLVADFSIPRPYSATVGLPVTMTAATNECVTDATYEWDTGQGFVTGSSSRSVTFEEIGTYPVTLKVSSPTYGTKTVTKPVAVVQSPFEIDICAKGTVYFIGGLPDVIATCAEITTTPPLNGVIFKVTHQGLGASQYQWKRRDEGSAAWIDVGGVRSSDQYFVEGTPGVSYEVKCVVTCASGTGISAVRSVIYVP